MQKLKNREILYYIINNGEPVKTRACSINGAKATADRDTARGQAAGTFPPVHRVAIVLLNGSERVELAVRRPAAPSSGWATTQIGHYFTAWAEGRPSRRAVLVLPARIAKAEGGPKLPYRYKWYGKPKAGERFVSGAVPEAYLAANDLSGFYHVIEF